MMNKAGQVAFEISRGQMVRLGAAGLFLMTFVLRLAGRAWWCPEGDLSPWNATVQSIHNSQHLWDPYTFTHVIHGFGFYAVLWLLGGKRFGLNLRAVATVALEASWEILENMPVVIERYRAATLALGYHGDTIFNSVGDVVACVAGFSLAAVLPARMILLITLALETLLLLWIRDSLLLNIIMLIWPIDAIKAWQLG